MAGPCPTPQFIPRADTQEEIVAAADLQHGQGAFGEAAPTQERHIADGCEAALQGHPRGQSFGVEENGHIRSHAVWTKMEGADCIVALREGGGDAPSLKAEGRHPLDVC
jgi:hypothetical protein